jgi:ABC-type sulfate transport system permease component
MLQQCSCLDLSLIHSLVLLLPLLLMLLLSLQSWEPFVDTTASGGAADELKLRRTAPTVGAAATAAASLGHSRSTEDR